MLGLVLKKMHIAKCLLTLKSTNLIFIPENNIISSDNQSVKEDTEDDKSVIIGDDNPITEAVHGGSQRNLLP